MTLPEDVIALVNSLNMRIVVDTRIYNLDGEYINANSFSFGA